MKEKGGKDVHEDGELYCDTSFLINMLRGMKLLKYYAD